MNTSILFRPGQKPAAAYRSGRPFRTSGSSGAADLVSRDVLARFYRALGDPTRLALLEFCLTGERTGTECVAHVGLSQGRVSTHLACLVSCGLVSARRAGRFVYYQVGDSRVADVMALGQQQVADHTASIAACASAVG